MWGKYFDKNDNDNFRTDLDLIEEVQEEAQIREEVAKE